MFLCVFLLSGLTGRLAQPATAQDVNPIQWMSDADRAVDIAESTARPLLIYVPGDSDGESEIEDAQDRSFRDETVRGFVRQRMVPVRLVRSTATERVLHDLGVSAGFGLFLLVVTPDGEVVGRISPNVVANQPRLIRRLVELFRKYRRDLLDDELKPRLSKRQIDPDRVRDTLEIIREFLIAKADKTVAHLLERPELRDGLRRSAYDTLATLSTEVSVKALLDAARQDETARRALRDCTPAGAAHMLSALTDDAGKVRIQVYEAITTICDIENAKPRLYWQSANAGDRKAEINRVRSEVKDTARRWRQRYEALR